MKRGYTIDDDLRELILSLVDQDNLVATKIIEDALSFQDPSARPAVENLLRSRGISATFTPPRARDAAAL